jgi:hypothetical protein
MKHLLKASAAFLLIIITFSAKAQSDTTMPAGMHYKRSSFYQSLWGSNFRKEWTISVKYKILMLDTAYGGLKVTKEGGGHQSKSLHILSKDGKVYALRSVDKTVTKVMPPDFQHTFIEHLVGDQVSQSHPYAALAVPIMARAAGIYYTTPVFYYVPKQAALGKYNEQYGNNLYLFEQKPDEDWTSAQNLGGFKKFISSEKLLNRLYDDNHNHVDQVQFVRSRIFDFFIGDWDRHLEQWKWGVKDSGNMKLFVPIPTDRDQAFVKFNGPLVKLIVGAAGMDYLKNFDYKIKKIGGFSYERRNLDRLFTNEITLAQWRQIAEEVRASLTDEVIESAIRQLPAEVFPISGNDIIAKLKVRRNDLPKYAEQYYRAMAKEVEIVGTHGAEYFKISRVDNNNTLVNIFRIRNNGVVTDHPYYSRSFKTSETKEIRIYGLSGKDTFKIEGDVARGINIRIIGGDQKDTYIENSTVLHGTRLHIYDTKDNDYSVTTANTFIHNISKKDTSFHVFDYDTYKASKKGIGPDIFYNNEDRIYVGLAWKATINKWRRYPFAMKEKLSVHYSISQKAFSVNYDGIFTIKNNKSALLVKGYYDQVRWTNFYGLGNETVLTTKDVNYFRMQTEEWYGSAGVRLTPQRHHRIDAIGYYGQIRPIHDTARFLFKEQLPAAINTFDKTVYLGATLTYSTSYVNDSIIPTKGVSFTGNASYTNNLEKNDFGSYSGELLVFVPVGRIISIASRAGGETITGTPEFYQYPWVGGSNLRGYRINRFHGKSTFYNNNELRFLFNIKSYAYKGKIGVLGFYDEGRVWMPGETSNKWHTAYGGGILLVPFNKIALKATYGISPEISLIQLSVNKMF